MEVYLRLLAISYQVCRHMVHGLNEVSLGEITDENLSVFLNIPFEHHLHSYFGREENYLQECYTRDTEDWNETVQSERLSQSTSSMDLLDSIHRNLSAMKRNFLVSI
jgi:hypothetical protein